MTSFISIEREYSAKLIERDIAEELETDFLVTSMFFAQLAYYSASYIQNRLIKLGAESIAIYSRNGVQAMVAEFDTVAIVAFKGSEATRTQDIKTDFKFWTSVFKGHKVHSGFLESYKQVSKHIMIDVGEIGHDKRVVFVGHSLGGALSYLLSLEFRPDDVVTFGAPRVFKSHKIDQYFTAINHVRVISDNDFVPTLPPTSIGYRHIGDPLIVPGRNGKWNSHKLKTYMRGILQLDK